MAARHPGDEESRSLAERIVAALTPRTRISPATSTESDIVELAAALSAHRERVWVLDREEPDAHLYATVMGHLEERVAYTGLDGSSGSSEEIAELLVKAGADWREHGARTHQVWVRADSDAERAWLSLGYEHLEIRGLRSLDGLPTLKRSRYEIERSEGDIATALFFEDLIDEAHALAPARGRRRRARRSALSRLLHDPDTVQNLVRAPGGPIAQCISFPAPPTRGVPDNSLHLSAVAVVPQKREMGVGRELVQRVLTRARDNGHANAEVVWRVSNPVADEFWRSLGFESFAVRLSRPL